MVMCVSQECIISMPCANEDINLRNLNPLYMPAK